VSVPPAPARSPAGLLCHHCALPVPPALVEPGAERQFCCQGCRAVYTAIHECGLERYYALRDAADAQHPGRVTAGRYASFDDPVFRERYVSTVEGRPATTVLYLEEMHCAACIWLLERLPQVIPGVIEVRVDFGRRLARVSWDERRVKLSEIARRLDSLGYPAHPYRPDQARELHRREERRHLIRIGIAGACAGNVMLIAFALWGGMFSGMDPAFRALFRWSSLALTLIALLGPGRVFFVGALSSLRTRMMHMDVPVAIALTAGTVWGAVNTFSGAGEVYFESLTAVIFLLLVGRWIQFRHQRAAQDAVEQLYRLTPQTARRIEPEGVREVPVEALEPGDRVELRAGESVPADGVLAEGRSEFDLSLLTGESRPVGLGVGEPLHAGTVNLSSRVVLEVRSTGAQTRVGRLMAMVERFAADRPPIVRLADRAAHWFVIAALALAALTVLLWWRTDPRLAVEHAIALLIVTCPCALGLATPLALTAAIGRAAGEGILIKGGEVIERLARPGRMLLDKTGTLTEGRIALVHWEAAEEVRPLVHAVESQVAHPVAAALVEAFESEKDPRLVAEAEQIHGGGAVGRVAGQELLIGTPRFVGSRSSEVPDWAERAGERCAARALTPVFVALDGRVVGVAGLGDRVLDDAVASVAALRRAGWRVGLISGDHPAVAGAVAREIGIDAADVEGGASPERKVEAVQQAWDGATTVVMVGDGVNDATALSAAAVGIAVHGGAEASLAAADVFLRRPGVAPVVELIQGAPRAVGVIRRNLGVSLLYNGIAAGFAMAGLINPLIAAVLMPLSSLSVLTLSWRSRTFGR